MPQQITLIHAAIASSGFDSYGKAGMDGTWISHGLCSLGAVLREAGHTVDLLDLRALAGWEAFEDEVRRRGPRIYGITMMTVDYDPAVEAARRIKALLPNAVVVTGGPHPTIMTDEALAETAFDHVFIREGEIVFPRFVARLEKGEKPPRRIEGEPPDLDALPFAARDLYPALETPLPDFPEPFVTLIAGRGCMYHCSFCMPAEKLLFGKRVRRRSPENFVRELKALKEQYRFRSFLIHDDCLTEDREWVKGFCELYRAAGFDAVFACQSRADLVVKYPEMFAMMRDAGLRMVFIGFESGSDRVLKVLRKGVTVAQNIEAGRVCKRLGLKIWANYMFGVPTETPEEMMDTARMIRRINPDVCSPAFFTPHPGSDLYDYCEKEGLNLIKKHSEFSRNPTSAKVRGIDYEAARRAVEFSKRKPFHLWAKKKISRALRKRLSTS